MTLRYILLVLVTLRYIIALLLVTEVLVRRYFEVCFDKSDFDWLPRAKKGYVCRVVTMGTLLWRKFSLHKLGGGGSDDHDFLIIWPTSGCHGRMVKISK